MSDLVKTYIHHKDKMFFVSTMNREASTLDYSAIYAETMAFEYDKNTKRVGKIVAQTSSAKDSIGGHIRVCAELFKTGEYQEDEQ